MRIIVTVHTLNMLGPVYLPVTGRTLRHEFRIVFFHRVVGVKNLMTLAAVELVFAAHIFQRSELARMTLTALGDGQRWRFDSVEAGILRRQVFSLGSLSQGGGNRPGGQKKDCKKSRYPDFSMNMAAHGLGPFLLFTCEVVQVVSSVVAAAALREF